jgi:hypothetical protein
MENQNLSLSKQEIKFYINLITQRFLSNPRMTMLFNKNSNSFNKNVKNLVQYCFLLAYKNNGIYIAKNKKTIMLFYKKKLKKNIFDHFRYLKVIIGISTLKLFKILKNEKLTNEAKIKLDNYIYVWFIAQEIGYGKLDGLIEVNNILFEISKNENLPILFETSDKNLLHLYNRAGFVIYNTLSIENQTINFFINKNHFINDQTETHQIAVE